MHLHSMVSGQVAQGGCVQTHCGFGSEELKALSWAHSDWREAFYLHCGHDKAGWELGFDGEPSSLCMRSAVPQEGSASRAEAGWRPPAGA